MVKEQEPTPGTVGGTLLSLVNGTHPKSGWVRGGMLASGVLAAFLADLLGWRQYRTHLLVGLVAAWFLIALVFAFRESRSE
jgi:hypothetical protein